MLYSTNMWVNNADKPLYQSYLFNFAALAAAGLAIVSFLERFEILQESYQYGVFSELIVLMLLLTIASFKKAPYLDADDSAKKNCASSLFYASCLISALAGCFFMTLLYEKLDLDNGVDISMLSNSITSIFIAVGLICVFFNIGALYFMHWSWVTPKKFLNNKELEIAFLKNWQNKVQQGSLKSYDKWIFSLMIFLALLYLCDKTLQLNCRLGIESFVVLGFIAYTMARFFYQAPLLMPQERSENPSLKMRVAFHALLVLCGLLIIASLATLVKAPTSELILNSTEEYEPSTKQGVLPAFALATLTPVLGGGVYAYRKWNPY